MAGNTTGTLFRLTTFGESHGKAIGGIVDGCLPGLELDEVYIQKYLDRRKPGYSDWASARKEQDTVEILSGLFEGRTTGAPVSFIIRNHDQKPADYEHNRGVFRPSHADYTLEKKYGIRDHRGGGRLSGRETASRVAAGAIARLMLEQHKIRVVAFTSQVGQIAMDTSEWKMPEEEKVYGSLLRCPDTVVASHMADFLEHLRREGDTAGGTVSCVISGLPPGLGEPVFDKLDADLAKAMISIGGAKGFEIGSGFKSASAKGSEHNDSWFKDEDVLKTKTNNAGGVLGGISNGMDITINVAFKPVPSIGKTQETINNEGKQVVLEGKGRHDICLVPRAVPVVEAMACLVVADHLLRQLPNMK
jgi:chorismate synthase